MPCTSQLKVPSHPSARAGLTLSLARSSPKRRFTGSKQCISIILKAESYQPQRKSGVISNILAYVLWLIVSITKKKQAWIGYTCKFSQSNQEYSAIVNVIAEPIEVTAGTQEY